MVVGAYPVLAVSYKDGTKLCMCLIRILNKPDLQDMSRLRWITWINRHFDHFKHHEVLGVKVATSSRYSLDGRLALASLL
jgi:hypothetical protein